MDMKCIICKEEKGESKEHIIPEALGNKTLVTKRVCKECNNKLGSNVDDCLVNNFYTKIVRINFNLTGKNGKLPRLFNGTEVDGNTNSKFSLKNDIPKLLPAVNKEEDGNIRVTASNLEEAMDCLKKYLWRNGFGESQIERICESAQIVERKLEPPIFRAKKTEYNKLKLAAIKIAYEYAFHILGEKYLDDEIAILFSNELFKATKEKKGEVVPSDELMKFVTFPNEVDRKRFEGIRNSLSFKPMGILNIINLWCDGNIIYCDLNLCRTDICSFVVKVSENANSYSKKLPVTLISEDGETYSW